MMTTIAGGDGSLIVEPLRTIVREDSEWRALWAVHAGPEAAAPAVDFSTHVVAAAFAGERPSPGFAIEITGTRQQGAGRELVVSERAPGPGAMVAQMVVTPFHIVSLPRSGGEVRFADAPAAARASRAGAAPLRRSTGRRQLRAEGTSSTGLDPHFAAALSYLAGPFSGVLVVLAERTNRFVRFHAWQSILGLGGLGMLAVLFLLSAFAALLISPTGFTVMYWMAFITALAWLILWAICLQQAFTGRALKLPLVGEIAERRSAATSDASSNARDR